MKKLLVLILALGVASASYGSVLDDFLLQLDEATDTLFVIGLVADPGVNISAGIYDQDEQGDFSNEQPLSDGSDGYAAGALWNIVHFSGAGYEGYDITVLDSSPSTDPVDAMPWFSMTYTGNVGDTMYIYDYWVSPDQPAGTMQVGVPEPMSIVLLGLGGLLLRRCRKQ